MVQFNPDIGNAPSTDFTGVSRGTGPNRAFEALFSGVGNAVEQGVRTADTYIQNRIEDDARYGFESQNQEFGVDPQTVPSEITQTQEGLSSLALAHQQGKVTPEYYYQRLTATMKGLRAKYPGYEKEVDNIIQSVTGTRPANAFRDALFQNIQAAQQAASSSRSKTETFVQSNSKYLNEDEILNPEKYGGLEGLSVQINLRKSREYQWEAEEKQVERDQKLALPTLNQRFNFTASDSLSQLSKAVGFGDQSFDQGLRNLGSTGFTPEQQANAIAGIDAVITQTEAKMLADQNRPAFSTLPPTQLRDMRQAALQPLRDIREKIAGKDYSGASILAASLQLQQDQAKAQLYKTDPRFTTLDALKGIAPDVANTMTNEIIQESGSSRAFFDKVSTYNLVGGVVQGADTTNAVIDRLENNPNLNQSQKNAEAASYVDGLTRTLGKAEIPGEQLSKIITDNYSEDSGADKLWSAVTSDQKLALYSKLFSPEITKKVFENGSDAAKAAYQNAAVNRFQNIPEFREAAGNLSEQLPYAQFARATYDPSSNRLRIDVDRSAMANLGYFQRDNQQAEIQRLGQFADKFNQALGVMAPIIEGAGGDETEGVRRLLSDMNVELNGGKQSGVYYWLSTVVDELLKPSTTEGVDVNQSRENMGLSPLEEITSPLTETEETENQNLSFNFPELTPQNLESVRSSGSNVSSVLNLIGHTEGTDRGASYNETLGYGAYTGGPVNLTGMTLDEVDKLQGQMLRHPENSWNSSAIGRYQIVRTTLRSLKKQLGLKGDEKFTPQLQDRLAEQLLKNRGYDDWKSGKISDTRFINNLAKEWASLPTASGRGAYAGQGVRARPSDVLLALQSE